jgi:hypothetical protein
MALSMKIQVNRTRGRTIFLGLAMGALLFGSASCSSLDEATRRTRVEHLVSPGPKAPSPPPNVARSPPPNLASSSASVPTTQAPASAPESSAPAPAVVRPLSRSEYFERYTGIELSPRDKAILDNCPARAWSKRVPSRRCTKHDECGDGFCDRGRCAAIWTCDASYGRRCESDDHCSASLLCNNGRCGSCTSTEECERQPEFSDPRCVANFDIAGNVIPGARRCIGTIGGMSRRGGPSPSPTPPKP